MTEEVYTPGTKVWVNSMERAGMIVRVERDPRYGAQYLVSVHDPETIEDTYPYVQHWVKTSDFEITVQPNRKNK